MKPFLTFLFCMMLVVSKSQTTISTSYVSTTVTFSTGLTYVTFAVKNNNSYPITLTSLSTIEINLYEDNVYTLWYSSTSTFGPPTVTSAAGWSIAATSLQSFTPLAFGLVSPFDCIGLVIPPGQTYRFALQGSKGSLVRASVTPNIFSAGGVDLLVGNNSILGGTVGYFGWQNTTLLGSPYFFDGSITFATASAYTDLAVRSIIKPSSVCTSPSNTIQAVVCNKSPGSINFATSPSNVAFNINGPISQTANVALNSGSLALCACMNVPLSGVNFSASGNYNINATVSITGGPLSDANSANNSTIDSVINYKPIVSPPIDSICQNGNASLLNGFTASNCQTRDKTVIVNTLVATTPPSDGSSDANAGLFAQGSLPSLPANAIITGGKLFISNLNGLTTGTLGDQARFSIYSPTLGPAFPFLPGYAGNPLSFSVYNFDYRSDLTATQLNNMYTTIGAGGTFNVGYWETVDNAAGISDVGINAQTLVTEVQLFINYTLPSDTKWYTSAIGGSSFYTGSVLNPFYTPGSGLSSTSVTGNYTFYAACNADTNCRVPVVMTIKPSPTVVQDSLEGCEVIASTGNGLFDLTTISAAVSAFNPAATVSYYQDPGLTVLINNPSNYIANTGPIFSKVLVAGCSSSDTVYLTVNPKPIFASPIISSGVTCFPNSIDVADLINPFSTVMPGTDTLYYADSNYSSIHPNPHLINTIDTVYLLFQTNTTPACKDSAVAYINVFPPNNFIVNQNTSFNYSLPGNVSCQSLQLSDGLTDTLRSMFDCSQIASISDIPNAISLGNTVICEDIDASVQTHNGQPYVNRHYKITPTNNDSAMVCLYFLDDDFVQYNTFASGNWPLLPTSSNPSLTNNLCIAQIHNGDITTPGHTVTSIPNTAISASYNPSTTVWTLCFPVDSFSYFYVHSQNPFNIPLAVNMLQFTGKRMMQSTLLEWVTLNEKNNKRFVIQRSANGVDFQNLSSISSLADNGNSHEQLNYTFNDKHPMNGHNYYRLQTEDINGGVQLSKMIDIYFTPEATVYLYPNPTSNVINLEINADKATKTKINVHDATGRIVKTVELSLNIGYNETLVSLENLSSGIYILSLSNEHGTYFSETIKKE